MYLIVSAHACVRARVFLSNAQNNIKEKLKIRSADQYMNHTFKKKSIHVFLKSINIQRERISKCAVAVVRREKYPVQMTPNCL